MSEDRKDWCTVEYDGAIGAKGGVTVFRSNGLEFHGGDRVKVHPEAARVLIDDAVPGAIKVIEGKPADKVTSARRPNEVAAEKLVNGRMGLGTLFVGAQPVPRAIPPASIVRDRA